MDNKTARGQLKRALPGLLSGDASFVMSCMAGSVIIDTSYPGIVVTSSGTNCI